MKLAVIAYNFEHKKTQDGLLNLFLAGIPVDCVLAADRVELGFYQSKIRIAPKGVRSFHPREIAKRLGVEYFVADHKGSEVVRIVRERGCELGLILGARILPQKLIEAFPRGILNLHPGLIPENRGLDNIKWAVLRGLPQGATAHLITEKVDFGPIVGRKTVDIFKDDTLTDLYLRVQGAEQELMIDSIRRIGGGEHEFPLPSSDGEYFKSVPLELESTLHEAFVTYKSRMASA